MLHFQSWGVSIPRSRNTSMAINATGVFFQQSQFQRVLFSFVQCRLSLSHDFCFSQLCGLPSALGFCFRSLSSRLGFGGCGTLSLLCFQV